MQIGTTLTLYPSDPIPLQPVKFSPIKLLPLIMVCYQVKTNNFNPISNIHILSIILIILLVLWLYITAFFLGCFLPQITFFCFLQTTTRSPTYTNIIIVFPFLIYEAFFCVTSASYPSYFQNNTLDQSF